MADAGSTHDPPGLCLVWGAGRGRGGWGLELLRPRPPCLPDPPQPAGQRRHAGRGGQLLHAVPAADGRCRLPAPPLVPTLPSCMVWGQASPPSPPAAGPGMSLPPPPPRATALGTRAVLPPSCLSLDEVPRPFLPVPTTSRVQASGPVPRVAPALPTACPPGLRHSWHLAACLWAAAFSRTREGRVLSPLGLRAVSPQSPTLSRELGGAGPSSGVTEAPGQLCARWSSSQAQQSRPGPLPTLGQQDTGG